MNHLINGIYLPLAQLYELYNCFQWLSRIMNVQSCNLEIPISVSNAGTKFMTIIYLLKFFSGYRSAAEQHVRNL